MSLQSIQYIAITAYLLLTLQRDYVVPEVIKALSLGSKQFQMIF